MNIVIMITGSIVGVAYITELFIAWYSGVEYEQYAFLTELQDHTGGHIGQ
jgi:molybdopterin-containing oxidoreductase family membrane subunit